MNINFSAPVSYIKPISNHHILKASPYFCIFTGRIDKKNKIGDVFYIRPEIIYNKSAEIYIINFDNENNVINYKSNKVDNLFKVSGQILISNFKSKSDLHNQIIAVNLTIKNFDNLKINAITLNNGAYDHEFGILGKIVYFIYLKKYWITKKSEYYKNSSQHSNFIPSTNLIEYITKKI